MTHAAAMKELAENTTLTDHERLRAYCRLRVHEWIADYERDRYRVFCSEETSSTYFDPSQTIEERRNVCRYLVAQGLASWVLKDVR